MTVFSSPHSPPIALVHTGESDHEQIQREAAVPMAALTQLLEKAEISLQGRIILFRNDCTGALIALEKGSFASQFLQRQALLLACFCLDHGLLPLFLHTPGIQLIMEGIDNLSRAGVESLTQDRYT